MDLHYEMGPLRYPFATQTLALAGIRLLSRVAGFNILATRMGYVDKIFPLLGAAIAATLASILWSKREHRKFPFFLLYLASFTAIEILRFGVSSRYRLLFKVFWATEAVYAILALLALHEIFRRVFIAFYVDLWFKFLFPGAVALTLILTLWNALYNPPIQASRLIAFILIFGLAVNVIKVALFLMLLVLNRLFKLGWRFAPLGIALGFALSAILTAISYWARSEFGTKLQLFAKYGPPVANMIGLAVWLDTFLRPEPEPEWTSAITPRKLAEAIRRETESLRRILNRPK